ncbi:hypothetical protein HZH66_003823 [Vespula vulgaris]|uniref:Uncharacterized protein n=1 Tax=Vespula vulgaris TaxID=7454 RepID=A0A834KE05_VESVU|nr:hypothetical protein HZH66_003823 [Vespula vulgaris]
MDVHLVDFDPLGRVKKKEKRERNPREVLALQFEMVEIRNKEPTRIAKWGRGSGDRELNILCATLKVGERRRALVKESGRQEVWRVPRGLL